MSNILFDLSGKIDQQTVAALSAVKGIADSQGIHFFVVGASARDFILKHCYGIESRRMTTDIDLGVEVANWEQFSKLIESLKARANLSLTTGNASAFTSIPFLSISYHSDLLRKRTVRSLGLRSMRYS